MNGRQRKQGPPREFAQKSAQNWSVTQDYNAYSIYKYSLSQPTFVQIVLFTWQLDSTPSSGYHQPTTQEIETYTETKA
jgi:hypothetical protein